MDEDSEGRPPLPLFWTAADVAGLVGTTVATIRRKVWEAEDPLPCLKIGDSIFFEPDDVIAWARREGDRYAAAKRVKPRKKPGRPKKSRKGGTANPEAPCVVPDSLPANV